MRLTTHIVITACLLVAGCSRLSFDVSEAGKITFTHTTVSNGNPIQYSWEIPANEVRSVFKHLAPRDPKDDGMLVFGYQAATLEYDGKRTTISWCRVKMVELVVLFAIRGNDYILVEPYAGQFYKILDTHEKKMNFQP